MRHAASVKHDHMYAFLSILDPTFRRTIKPDYRSDVAQIFSDFALKYVQATRETTLLDFAVSLTVNPTKLPSWVPDFTSDAVSWLNANSKYVANTQIQSYLTMDDSLCLGVQASCLDHIVATQLVCQGGRSMRSLRDTPEEAAVFHVECRQFFEVRAESNQIQAYVGGGTLEEAYWKVMCGGRMSTDPTGGELR